MTRTREENAADLAYDAERTMVPVYVSVTGEATDPDDDGLTGVYLVNVSASLTDEQKAEAALDQFHDNQGIEVLDDFEIIVYSAEGTELPRMDNHVNESLITEADYRGGPMNEEEIPDAVRQAHAAQAAAAETPTP